MGLTHRGLWIRLHVFIEKKNNLASSEATPTPTPGLRLRFRCPWYEFDCFCVAYNERICTYPQNVFIYEKTNLKSVLYFVNYWNHDRKRSHDVKVYTNCFSSLNVSQFWRIMYWDFQLWSRSRRTGHAPKLLVDYNFTTFFLQNVLYNNNKRGDTPSHTLPVQLSR